MRGLVRDCLDDAGADALDVFEDLAVPETHNAKSLRFEISPASFICLAIYGVLSSVDLDDQAMLERGEIDNVMVDRLLTAKFCVGKLTRTEQAP